MKKTIATIVITFLLLLPPPIHSWQQWNYTNYATDDWRDIWGFTNGPHNRRGQTLILWNKTNIILFGGRDNEVHRPHVPKTYDLINDDGVLDFTTYEDKSVLPHYDLNSCQPVKSCMTLENAMSGNLESCSYSWEDEIMNKNNEDGDMTFSPSEKEYIEEKCGFVTSGVYYNDVWVYDLSCKRYSDLPCVDDGWRLLHPGVQFGGCRNDEENDGGERICDVPSERWGHGASMIDESTMMIYGGYSQECEDYCDDAWMFDLTTLEWKKIESTSSSTTAADDNPGRRWKFSMVSAIDNDDHDIIILFAGHRLWHGFSSENSAENLWESTELYPRGGYLNDLWILRKNTTTTTVHQDEEDIWYWIKQEAKPTYEPSPGDTWESRNDKVRKVYWPSARSGHTAVFDPIRKGMWIHGGFTSYYPYPSSSSRGSANGVNSLSDKGFTPHSASSFYLDDLWFYDITSGFWNQLKPAHQRIPERRTNHIMVYTRDIIMIHGGYSDNKYFNDTWYYYPDENKWLEKTEFVHANYPNECRDDLEYIQHEPNCVKLNYPPPLIRSDQSTYSAKYQEILPFQDQPGYTPDEEHHPLYFGIVDDAEAFVANLIEKYLKNKVYDNDGNRIWIESTVPDGVPIAPNAATGPRQYAQMKKMSFNATTTLDVWEWCTSVKGEPTRGKVLDGQNGRSNESIYVHIPRRQSPGWDGCRELEWIYPPSRADHKGVHIPEYNMILLYGGVGLKDNETNRHYHDSPSFEKDFETEVLRDMWTFNLENCPKNCSSHGVCENGFCHCDTGYYGLDCSNSTCPGSFCYYDDDHVQHCTHCCYDGYTHTDDDDDEYLAGVRKLPCHKQNSVSNPFSGNSNGICDGYGTCQCAPPFLGEDCSMKDCKHNCSFNGHCSVEFPISRCICKDGYFGEFCQYIQCLHNCTYPNGVCDHRTGICQCNPIYSPYNSSRLWSYWGGEDCSYLTPWCGSNMIKPNLVMLAAAVLVVGWLLSSPSS